MRILYVEDNDANVFLVRRVARVGEHDVIHHPNGQSALDSFERDNPDLVLMDIQLPGKLDGLDVVRALRAAGHRVPIIAVTAYAMIGDRERCIQAGCDGYMPKPVSVDDMIELFERYASRLTAAAPPPEAADKQAETLPVAAPVPDAAPDKQVESPASEAGAAVTAPETSAAAPSPEPLRQPPEA